MTIKELRERTYLSQSKFAELTGIPVVNIQRWEQGRTAPPSYLVVLLESYLRCKGLL